MILLVQEPLSKKKTLTDKFSFDLRGYGGGEGEGGGGGLMSRNAETRKFKFLYDKNEGPGRA